MRLTGEGIYGEPPRRDEALEILRQTAKRGINFLDTVDYYGGVSNVNAAELQAAMGMGEIGHCWKYVWVMQQRDALIAPHGETRGAEEILHICEENEIPLIPFFSLLTANQKKITGLPPFRRNTE